LSKAQPLVEKALMALKSLDVKDFQEAKTMGKPKYTVSCVFIATLWIVCGMKDPDGTTYKFIERDKKGKPKKSDW
jgi:hypothetical protein